MKNPETKELINTLEELLQDYACYSLNIGLIDEKQRQALEEKAPIYIRHLNHLNLLGVVLNKKQKP